MQTFLNIYWRLYVFDYGDRFLSVLIYSYVIIRILSQWFSRLASQSNMQNSANMSFCRHERANIVHEFWPSIKYKYICISDYDVWGSIYARKMKFTSYQVPNARRKDLIKKVYYFYTLCYRHNSNWDVNERKLIIMCIWKIDCNAHAGTITSVRMYLYVSVCTSLSFHSKIRVRIIKFEGYTIHHKIIFHTMSYSV